jgi:hypothetical protein
MAMWHPPQWQCIERMKPRDRANAFFRLMVSSIADVVAPSGDDAALDDLATAAAGIACHALAGMSDMVDRDKLLAHLIKGMSAHIHEKDTLYRLMARKLSPGNFGLLQQYRHSAAYSR